jgi:hypothetical protein
MLWAYFVPVLYNIPELKPIAKVMFKVTTKSQQIKFGG